MKYNKITLSFPKDEEIHFRKEYFQNSIFQFRIAFILLIFLYGVFGLLDNLIIPEFSHIFHLIRFAFVIPIFTIVFIMSYFKVFEKVWQKLLFICFIVGGTGISIMTMLAPENYSYYAGMMLVFFAGYFFIKLRFFWASLAGWIVLIIYNIGAIAYADTPYILLINNNFFFASANLIGMFAAYNIEYYARRNFYLNQAQAQSNIFLDKIIDSIPDPLFIKDQDHKLIIVNQSYSDLLGRNKSEILNKSDYDIFPKEQADVFWKMDKQVFDSSKENTNEEVLTNKQGESKLISTKKTVIQNQIDGSKILVGIIRDITELKNTEKILINNQEKLKELNATKDKFISILAHDMKNPFSTLISFSELLYYHLDKLDQETIKQYISYIYDTTLNTNSFLDELLVWARSQKDEIAFQPTRIRLNTLVSECMTLIFNSAHAKGIKIINNISNDLYIYADVEMIKTIFRNLLTNALKFTNKSGEINIFAKMNGSVVEVSVVDNGIGMNEDTIKSLFQIGKSKSGIGTAGERGTGFGLMLCKQFVEKHQGTIWVDSEIGKGSAFFFTLPILK